MPILNLNGTTRKHGIATGKTIKGTIFGAGLAKAQHDTTLAVGKSYNSPFTHSSANLFPKGQTVSTQPHVQALKHEQPGSITSVQDFVKIHPWEKGKTWSTTPPVQSIVQRTGGPSKDADVPSNPNARYQQKQPRPALRPVKGKNETLTNLSFVRSGGTIGGHADPQAGTSSDTSRWHTTKKGAVG
jgi:hypothetical protein